MDNTQAPRVSAPSVVEPIQHAIDWTGYVLFRPFDLQKWFVLGFCAWLALLTEGGGAQFQWNVAATDPDPVVGPVVEQASEWVSVYLGLVIFVAVVLFLVLIALVVVLTWLSSRGRFMFLDGVVHDRGAVVEPWRRFRALGNSLFGFRIVLGLSALAILGALLTLMMLNLMALGLDRGEPGPVAIAVLAAWVFAILGLGLAFALVGMALNDFVVPIMWLRNMRVMAAWSEFRSILAAHVGIFILYLLMKILIVLVTTTLACLATCITCCIAGLPYIGTVLLLPLHVFKRCYSIYFLGQFSADYAPLAPVETPPPPPPA